MPTVRLSYATSLDPSRIQEEIDLALAEVLEDASNAPADVDLDQLSAFDRSHIDLDHSGSPLDADTVSLIVTIVTTGPAYDLWKHLLLPRILRRFGEDSMKGRADNDK